MASGPCALNIGNTHATSPTSYTAESFAGPATYDSGVFWDSGQPTRATAPTGGWYFMYASVGGAASCGYRARFAVNGVVVSPVFGQGAGANVSTEAMHMQYLFAGDYIELLWLCTNASRAAVVFLEVTRLPTPLFVGHCANGDSDYLTWVKDEGCQNDPRLWWDEDDPTRVTVDENGTYLVMTAMSSSNDMWVTLVKNHTSVLHQGHNQLNSLNGGAPPGGPTMVSLHELSAGDYLEVNTDTVVFPSWFAVAQLDPLTNMVQAEQTVGTTEQPYVSQPTLTDFDTETVDTNGFHGSPTTRITVPPGLGGDYWVFANASIQSTNIIHLSKNGAVIIGTDRCGTPNIGANNNRWTHGHMTWFETLADGDYFDISIFTAPGRTTDPFGTFLGMMKLDSDSAPWPYESCVPQQIYRWLKK